MTHSRAEVDSEVEEGVAEADEVEVILLEALCGEDEAALVAVEEDSEEEGL